MILNIGNNYRKNVLLLILFFSVLRLIFAFWIELANDESYYWLYSLHIKANYFDHPPLIAIWIRIFTLDFLLPQSPGFLRLGSIAGCAISSWFMFRCVSLLSSERAGWFAVCLYNASFYSGITAGFLVMPDTPQMVFFTLSLWLIAKLTINDARLSNWLWLGISIGLCIMSKVHGVFLWTGLGLYILFYKRNWLLKPGLYLSVLITTVTCLPILFWNIRYHFVTYSFNSSRINLYGASVNWKGYFSQIIQQVGVNNPFNILIIVLAFFGWKKYKLNQIPALKIYNLVGIPFALILLYIPLFRENILPHWSGPAYVALIPLAAIRLDRLVKPKRLSWLVSITLINYVFYLVICCLLILYYPGTFGSTSVPKVGTKDLSIDFYGWKESGEKFDSIYAADISKKIVPPNTPVVCYKWWGSHIEYYFCRPLNIPMIGLGSMMDIHEYMWMNELRKDRVNFNNAYCIVSSDEYYNPKIAYKNYFKEIDFIKAINVSRSGKPAHDFYMYRLKGWKGSLPVMK